MSIREILESKGAEIEDDTPKEILSSMLRRRLKVESMSEVDAKKWLLRQPNSHLETLTEGDKFYMSLSDMLEHIEELDQKEHELNGVTVLKQIPDRVKTGWRRRQNVTTLFESDSKYSYAEGYWLLDPRTYSDRPLPYPVPNDSQVHPDFIKALKIVENDPDTRRQYYKNSAMCRFEDYTMVGRGEYIRNDLRPGGELLVWPDGNIHYYEKHNVLPSVEFYNFIMRTAAHLTGRRAPGAVKRVPTVGSPPRKARKPLSDKILNPATGRMVKRTGRIGKAILARRRT